MRKGLLFVLMLIIASLCMGTAIGDDFNAKIRNLSDEAEVVALVKEYLAKTNDIDDLRNIQSVWLDIDQEACRAHFEALYRQNPKNDNYHYLWARALRDVAQTLSESRKLIKRSPKYYWGYRLLNATYNITLFNNKETSSPEYIYLQGELKKDRKLILESVKRFPEDSLKMQTLYYLYRYEDNLVEAKKLLLNLNQATITAFSPENLLEYSHKSKDTSVFATVFPLMLQIYSERGRIKSEDIENIYANSYLDLLFGLEDWAGFEAFFKANPQQADNRDNYEILISYHIKRGDHDRALDLIATLLREDRTDFRKLERNKDYNVFSTNPKWLKLKYEAKLKWDQDAGKRIQKALENDRKEVAFAWELPDKDGNIIRLKDQKGSIVILDFWATWCSPCRMAMPVIDDWMKKKMPDGVLVYSINVWEREPAKAKAFMEEKGYAMTLLYGSNDLSEKYGFTGIPFICVIDQEGNLRFFESGYSEDLADHLSIWVEALQKPQSEQ